MIKPIQKILLWGLLPFIWTGANAQNDLTTQKIIIYKDLAQVSQKGILRFDKSRSDVEINLTPIPETVEFRGTGEFRIAWYKFREDSATIKVKASNWKEVILANKGRNIIVVYQIGAEFDEIEGTVTSVNETQGFVVLSSTRGNDFILPIDQVRQVIVGDAGKLEVEKKVPRQSVSLGIREDVPFVPVEMTCLHEGLKWDPVCRIKLQNTRDALVQSSAQIRNDAFDLEGVEVELSPGYALSPGESSGNPTQLGKLSIKKGEIIMVNLDDNTVEYEDLRQAAISWNGIESAATTQVERILSFKMPTVSGMSCGNVTVLDPANRHLANMDMSGAAPGSTVQVVVEKDRDFGITCNEAIKKEGKTTKIGGKEYRKAEVEGHIFVTNAKKGFAEVQIRREIEGTVLDIGKGNATDGEGFNRKWITWKQTVGGGEKKEITYRYEALIPMD
jgi:hypothetical protein